LSSGLDSRLSRGTALRERASEAAASLVRELTLRGLRLACAESCTGGLVSALLTEIPGASSVLWGSAISYSNDSKERLLQVPRSIIDRHGAVSGECASAMAEGIRKIGDVDLAIAITGIAGPDGGTRDKPVGFVWFAWALSGIATVSAADRFQGDRESIRLAAAELAMRGALDLVTDSFFAPRQQFEADIDNA
jgi:PncC family amidohydrolase